MNAPKRMLIVSFDAVGAKDIPYMKTLPNFQKFMQKAAICTNVTSVYPSVTYPAHTSVITGKRPVHHGVVNNTHLQPNRPIPDWLWQRKYIKGTTLYDELIQKGWKAAAFLWPVTARSRIQYNVPEIFANRPWKHQVLVSAFNGTPLFQIELYKRFGHMLDRARQPALDNFTHASAVYTLEKYKPDLTMIHYTDVDTNRHIYGVEHEKAIAAIERHDQRLGELLEVLERTGNMSETTVVLLGDHYQKDAHHIVYLNYVLKEHGYLQAKGNKITHYKAIAKNCDGSCYIYLHPKYRKDHSLIQEVTQLFEQLRHEEKYGISQVFSSKEAERLGADDTCVLMIEAQKDYYYLDEFQVLTELVEERKGQKLRAVHGYLPDQEGYKTFFMAAGCGIKENAAVDTMELCDEGVTLAHLLNCDMGQTDGRILQEILE